MATLDEIRLQQLLTPFNRTGVMSSSQAVPMINNIPMINTGAIDQSLQNNDLVEQIIAENQRKANQFDLTNFRSIFPTNVQTDIRQQVPLQNLGIDTSYGVANEGDVEQEFLPDQEPSGIAKLLSYLPFGENSILGTLIRSLPQESPEIRSMKNFYRNQYGLTNTGQVASGIMAGYNPVYGGFLNMLTGGRFGKPTQFGLANAARQRIEKIAKRKAPQTDASRAKIQELQKFAEADTISRARQAAPNVYRSAERQGFTGPGGGFSTSGREGAFSSKSGRGRKDF